MKYIYIKRLRKLGEDGDFSLTFILYWIANPTDQDKQIEFKWSLFYMNTNLYMRFHEIQEKENIQHKSEGKTIARRTSRLQQHRSGGP